MAIASLTSRIDKVKIYAAGATVTRVANLHSAVAEIPEHVEIFGLPLALDDSSVRVSVAASPGINPAIATDIRIGLAVPPRQEVQNSPTDEEVREAKIEVQRLEDAIALIKNEISILHQLDVPKRPEGEEGKAPPPSPLGARLALANFKDEQIRDRIAEKWETLERLRIAREHLKDLLEKQARASSAKEVRPNELRKTVIVQLSYEGEPSTLEGQNLVVEYFVPGARWTPTYVCRLDSVGNQANIAVRALICQRTGEDWSGVSLELSTAEPLAWCELPELPSLRLGRAQPMLKKSGWRRPPVGAEILFEDYDRQKQQLDVNLPEYVESLRFALNFGDRKVRPLSKISSLRTIFASFSESGFADMGNFEMMPMSASVPMASAAYEEYEDQSCALELESPTPSLQNRLEDYKAKKRTAATPQAPERQRRRRDNSIEETSANFFAYGLMRLGTSDDSAKRGKLSIEQRQEVYLETLKRRNVVVSFDVIAVVQQAVTDSQNCIYVNLPPGGINVRTVAGSFDYAYNADGRVDVPSDGEFHSVALTSNSTDVDLRYVVVPREDTNVFRIAQLKNPLQAPLLAGPADVYVDGEYILSTNITTVPPKGQMELGLGVEQAIKVARNTTYQEVRSGETLVAFNELRHNIQIDIANRLPKEARIEVRERLPIPDENAKVDVQLNHVSPNWEKYEQKEREVPIKGGYRWRVQVPAKEQTTLTVQYTIKTFVDNELMGGNRRE